MSVVAVASRLARVRGAARHTDLLRGQRPAGPGVGGRPVAGGLARTGGDGSPAAAPPAPAVGAAGAAGRVADLVGRADRRRDVARLDWLNRVGSGTGTASG